MVSPWTRRTAGALFKACVPCTGASTRARLGPIAARPVDGSRDAGACHPNVSTHTGLQLQPPPPPTRTRLLAHARTSRAQVKFCLKYRTNFGQSVKLIGSHAKLGSWDLGKALELTWSEGDRWIATVELPAGGVYEYKWVGAGAQARGRAAWRLPPTAARLGPCAVGGAEKGACLFYAAGVFPFVHDALPPAAPSKSEIGPVRARCGGGGGGGAANGRLCLPCRLQSQSQQLRGGMRLVRGKERAAYLWPCGKGGRAVGSEASLALPRLTFRAARSPPPPPPQSAA